MAKGCRASAWQCRDEGTATGGHRSGEDARATWLGSSGEMQGELGAAGAVEPLSANTVTAPFEAFFSSLLADYPSSGSPDPFATMSRMPTRSAIADSSGQKPSIRELAKETHVWSVHLAAGLEGMQQALSLLSPEEHVRRNEFRLGSLQQRYTLARAALRRLLAAYLDVAAGSIPLRYGAHGKPFLQDTSSRLQFNLAHSGDLCVLAFTLDSDVGVDVERVRALRDAEAVARRFFSKEECEDLLETPAAQREQAFFRCWTRKEAFVKAVGTGLYFPLNHFRVSLQECAALLEINGSTTEAQSWRIHDLPTQTGYAAALAVHNPERGVRNYPVLTARNLLEG